MPSYSSVSLCLCPSRCLSACYNGCPLLHNPDVSVCLQNSAVRLSRFVYCPSLCQNVVYVVFVFSVPSKSLCLSPIPRPVTFLVTLSFSLGHIVLFSGSHCPFFWDPLGSGAGVMVQPAGSIVITERFAAGKSVTFPVYATDQGQVPGPLTSKPLWVSLYTLVSILPLPVYTSRTFLYSLVLSTARGQTRTHMHRPKSIYSIPLVSYVKLYSSHI